MQKRSRSGVATVEKLPAEIPALTVDPEIADRCGREDTMGYREAREVARIRQELRDRLMSEHHDGAAEVLARLRFLAEEDDDTASPELRSEYERWKIRFELLAATARNN
jgi:hypothetical protein